MKRVFVFLILATACSGCGFKYGMSSIGTGPSLSTISGNPLTTKNTAASATILNAVCGLIQTCNGVMASACVTAVSNESDASVLGLSASQYPTYGQVVSAEIVGTLTPNQNGAASCLGGIAAETCTSISGAYNPTLTDPYANVSLAFPGSCKMVFGSSEQEDDHEDN